MPELPEVEVSRMGIYTAPLRSARSLRHLKFRTPKLRWDIPQELTAS